MVSPEATVRPPSNVQWKIFQCAVFLLQQRRQGVINSCIVRRMNPKWTPLWEKIIQGNLDELSQEDREGITMLVDAGLLEEAQP